MADLRPRRAAHRCDPTIAPATGIEVGSGGVPDQSKEQRNGVVDAETVNDYRYDQDVNVAPQVTPTNVIGRLAHATSPTGPISLSYDAFGSVNARVFTGTHGSTYAERRAVHADGTRAALDLFLPVPPKYVNQMKHESLIDELRRDGQVVDTQLSTWKAAAGLCAVLDAIAREGCCAVVKIDGGRSDGSVYTVVVSGGRLGEEFFRKDGADLATLPQEAISFYRSRVWAV